MPQYRQDVYDTIMATDDRLGRQNPRLVFNFATMLRSIPGWAALWSPIPGEFWAESVTDERYSVAVVACPCGQAPAVEAGQMMECACERHYFFSGGKVLVANSPVRDLKPKPLDAEEAALLEAVEPPTPAAP